jgi:hypothetical protein
MTLGGLALAVGILVDEATVTIENIHTHLADGRSLARAAREATAETTLPRFVAMLCILAVFIPAFFMTGAAHNLFVPLALAVGSRWWGRICFPAPLCRYWHRQTERFAPTAALRQQAGSRPRASTQVHLLRRAIPIMAFYHSQGCIRLSGRAEGLVWAEPAARSPLLE